MTSTESDLRRLTTLSMGSAVLLLAHQLAGKAARDGLFLSRFEAGDLPKVVVLAALVAVVLGLGFARLLSRYGPQHLVPFGMLASGLLHGLEYLALSWAPDLTVYVIYLHIVGFGAVMLSGFWSLVSEVFDPREAKLRFGRIAGAGTAGGILGGIAAERVVALSSSEGLLLLLALLHVAAGAIVLVLSRGVIHTRPTTSAGQWNVAREAFRQAPFLLNLAVLVILATTSAGVMDFLFKSGATEAMGKGPALTRFFVMFYTGSQVLTFLAQTFLSPLVLSNLGLGRTVKSLPMVIAGGSLAALYVPAFAVLGGVRSLELILRGSFFRSGYELFFTPIPPAHKRSVKTIIDVACDRFGDAVGAMLVQAVLLLGPEYARTEMLLITVAIAMFSIWLMGSMDSAYVGALEHGLKTRAVELDLNEIEDSTTLSVVMKSIEAPAVRGFTGAPVTAPATAPTPPMPHDPALDQLQRLRGSEARAVRNELLDLRRWDPLVVPQVIRLLAWDEVSEAARQALTRWGSRVVGQLTDTLLDDEQDFAIRRRIPRILARCSNQRAVEGLLPALADPRFEIRFQTSRALDFLHQHQPSLRIDRELILATVSRELSVSRPIWEGRRLLDSRDESDSSFSYLDDILKERANQSLEHVFSLLSVLLPREPLKTAFRALHSEDRLLRGLGLEYLASTLSEEIFAKLTALVEHSALRASSSTPDEILAQLMASGNSIVLELKKQSGAG
ncbi:MAG: hypothetical protein NW208_01490 [Bryobacter sp.]|nr:hypothetical protein [Bryobacter sp.]